jgi:hypothetical protein
MTERKLPVKQLVILCMFPNAPLDISIFANFK